MSLPIIFCFLLFLALAIWFVTPFDRKYLRHGNASFEREQQIQEMERIRQEEEFRKIDRQHQSDINLLNAGNPMNLF